MTNLPVALENRANLIIRSAWATMGIPFDVPMLNEKKEGIIDVESLLMITFLVMGQDRMITDLPAWIIRFSDVINHQKLRTMLNASPEKHRNIIIEKLNQAFFGATQIAFRRIFGIQKPPSNEIIETIKMRSSKLNSLEHVAQSSFMLNNRLLYGTGFRADLITITHIKNFKMNGTQLAKLLCTANSTISRILNDLRACQFLDRENERVINTSPYPGMFLSTQTIWNLYEILDAEDFRSGELKKATYENINFKNDGFCMQLIRCVAHLDPLK